MTGILPERLAGALRGEFAQRLHSTFKAVKAGKYRHALNLWVEARGWPSRRYAAFVSRRQLDPATRDAFIRKADSFHLKPKFSILLPTYNSPPQYLDIAIRSVLLQTYPHWELCIADDGSPMLASFRPMLEAFAAQDERIKLRFLETNGGISHASNAALSMASGDFIVLLDHDDEIQPHALHAFADAINRHPETDWLYSDEDKIDMAGTRFGPFFKPDWSPAYFLGCMYTCHLGAYRRSLAVEVGGFRSSFDTAQDYDFALRLASITSNVVHVPDVLYSWRTLPASTASGADAKPEAEFRARQAVQAFVDRGKYPGTVVAGPHRGTHRVRFDIIGNPRISIVIPSAGYRTSNTQPGSWYVLDLVESIRNKTSYENYEIIIVENGDMTPELRENLSQFDVVLSKFFYENFNLSEKMNFSVAQATGEYVVLLNDDMTIIEENWLSEMLMWAQQDDVCAVGAKLFFPDGRIQHAGVLLLGQGPSHPYYLSKGSEVGMVCNAILPHEASAVTGACLLVRKTDYEAIGGFDPFFAINYNDIDFCLRLRQRTGKRIIFTPFAQLYHYESVSRSPAPPVELQAVNCRWSSIIGHDPYYNSHLSQNSGCYEIASLTRSLTDDYGLALTDDHLYS